MISFPDAKKVAAMLAAVGEPTRMLILHRLAHGRHHVGALAELVGVPMVNMSHHLGVMRKAGLLDDEKDGRRVFYRLRPDITAPADDPAVLVGLSFGPYRVILARTDDAPAGKKAVKAKPEKQKPARKPGPKARTKAAG